MCQHPSIRVGELLFFQTFPPLLISTLPSPVGKRCFFSSFPLQRQNTYLVFHGVFHIGSMEHRAGQDVDSRQAVRVEELLADSSQPTDGAALHSHFASTELNFMDSDGRQKGQGGSGVGSTSAYHYFEAVSQHG